MSQYMVRTWASWIENPAPYQWDDLDTELHKAAYYWNMQREDQKTNNTFLKIELYEED